MSEKPDTQESHEDFPRATNLLITEGLLSLETRKLADGHQPKQTRICTKISC